MVVQGAAVGGPTPLSPLQLWGSVIALPASTIPVHPCPVPCRPGRQQRVWLGRGMDITQLSYPLPPFLPPPQHPGVRLLETVSSALTPLPSAPLQDIRNTVGNIPMEWYQDFPHIGYNLEGKKIYKPIRNKDELDMFLEKMENPDYW